MLSSEDNSKKSEAIHILNLLSKEGRNDTEPFIKRTVKELLWGYPSVPYSMDRQIYKQHCKCNYKCNCLAPFGVFQARNKTTLRTMNTGTYLPTLLA